MLKLYPRLQINPSPHRPIVRGVILVSAIRIETLSAIKDVPARRDAPCAVGVTLLRYAIERLLLFNFMSKLPDIKTPLDILMKSPVDWKISSCSGWLPPKINCPIGFPRSLPITVLSSFGMSVPLPNPLTFSTSMFPSRIVPQSFRDILQSHDVHRNIKIQY